MYEETKSSSEPRLTRAAPPSLRQRGALLLGILCVEVALLHAPYFGRADDVSAHQAVTAVLSGSGFVLFALAAFGLVCWPERRSLLAKWRSAAQSHNWKPWAIASCTLALITFLATFTARHSSVAAAAPVWLLIAPWAVAVFLMLVLLATAAAPISYWRALASTRRTELLISLSAVGLIWGIAVLSQNSWDQLSGATLRLSYWLLRQYESDAHSILAQRVLGVGEYNVLIDSKCSGYEGIGLVVGFLALYMIVFRRQLRFPNVLILFPLGALTIWLLNAVRLAVLVSIGAHISPGMAMHGFHSQAGSILFLAVAVGMMFATRRLAFLGTGLTEKSSGSVSGARRATAFLLPFIALMAGGLLSSMFLGIGRWLYVLEAAAVCGIIWYYRDVYRALIASVSLEAVLAGLLVGIAWVWTDPALGHLGPVDEWVASLPLWSAGLWLAVRIFGLIILVPIAEELAFRGYLHRALIARRWEAVSPGQFTWLAFLGSTILFGVMHSRWLSALLAGGIYAIVMYRSRRLSDPIAAHATSNAVIAVVAIVTRQWSLL